MNEPAILDSESYQDSAWCVSGRDSSGSSTTRLSGMRDCDSETSLKSLQVKMESDPHTPCRYLPLGFSMAIA
ncbi:uncharacterized protein BO96DRAFT_409226 [Aspergillus niger CBS 101883]|uniref:Uncharacterized protein n=1 Tax=Aspergillus niger ATCC 13496 TaxID=1353008 RepID=A0A370CCQ8_ASPNG|nr:uncharacterized protein BO96DRAFT_409226 [Aspergillus niger CBS 101883]PYH59987.1 hypothetical protein BO96DRAFT_409226 [Aspergillus niger CBS 101883]RDH24366.1 hypothetical protein M747DRAFT_116706 [Aspergillus niger ATCC 13496]